MKNLILIFLVCRYTAQAQLFVSTLAGSTASGSVNGSISVASFNQPTGICFDPFGSMYVADGGNNLIRKITPIGIAITIAGSGTAGFVNGTGSGASFSRPMGLSVGFWGDVYVADYANNVIRVVSPSAVVGIFAGTGAPGAIDGPSDSAEFYHPVDVAWDPSQNILYASSNNCIRKILLANNLVSTLAGSGAIGFANGTGTLATFDSLCGICTDHAGNIYAADAKNNAIRKITPAGVVTTFAGSGLAGDSDGTGAAARFNGPTDISSDHSGNFYVTDYNSSRIRKIDSLGVVTTMSGFAGAGFLNGDAQVAKFNGPCSVACSPGNGDIVYIADRANNSIRTISCTAVNPTITIVNTYIHTYQSATLTASGTGTINWYTSATGGTPVATGTVYVTPPLPIANYYTYYADASNSCTTTARTAFKFLVVPTAGINTIQNNAQAVFVYPNPTTGLLTVELSDADLKTIEVSDVTGRVLLSSSTSEANKQISLNAFANGVYYVKVRSGKGQNVMKVLKQ